VIRARPAATTAKAPPLAAPAARADAAPCFFFCCQVSRALKACAQLRGDNQWFLSGGTSLLTTLQ
jgi:hypothetical protein